MTSEEQSSFKKEVRKKKGKRFLTGRQAAWMIYEYFKVSDIDESVLDLHKVFHCAMGRNHHRNEENAFRMLFKTVTRETTSDYKDGGPILGTDNS